jgi:mannose-6-phosphate isomerase-like protein (cupin superfamily)
MSDGEEASPPELGERLSHIRSRRGLAEDAPEQGLIANPLERGESHYANANERLGIEFAVRRLDFPEIQVMDPRVVRIAPGRCNERHKHAHESIFVVLSGVGEVLVGEKRHPVRSGEVAFVPRWYFHQTYNTSTSEDLVVLAITDFGLTSAVLGDYDRRTRLADRGEDAGE